MPAPCTPAPRPTVAHSDSAPTAPLPTNHNPFLRDVTWLHLAQRGRGGALMSGESRHQEETSGVPVLQYSQ